jgi:hypothetical protein
MAPPRDLRLCINTQENDLMQLSTVTTYGHIPFE